MSQRFTGYVCLLQSLQGKRYDHHAAIYFLLLERLKTQYSNYPTPSESTSNSKYSSDVIQRRRPSTIAEQAMRKLGIVMPTSIAESNPVSTTSEQSRLFYPPADIQPKQQDFLLARSSLRTPDTRQVNQSTIRDLYQYLVQQPHYNTLGSSVSTEVVSNSEFVENTETDLEETASSNLRSQLEHLASCSSSVSSQGNKSLSQHLSSNSSTFSDNKVDSTFTSSLPSCSAPQDGIMSTVYKPHKPILHNAISRTITRSPIDFREGRRASDGLVARQGTSISRSSPGGGIVAFNSQRLNETGKTKGVMELHLVQREHQALRSRFMRSQHLPLNVYQQKRLQQTNLGELISRRQVLRQASYKLAQTMQILPPLPQETIAEDTTLHYKRHEDFVPFQSIAEDATSEIPPQRTQLDEACGYMPTEDGAFDSGEEQWLSLPSTMSSACQISDTIAQTRAFIEGYPSWQNSRQGVNDWNQVNIH
ncbi:hypothetical protein L9F63_018680 [Diploptera punctata]|uniref:Protein kinase SIK1/2/3 UBA domain-containing protein n=1 Tax=Diploptera punctata TaxID=6984 RepID=A0AAD7ZVW6_DIPPU|nr:hypothetical protein L9F63_018680 [Diploptera punctata]